MCRQQASEKEYQQTNSQFHTNKIRISIPKAKGAERIKQYDFSILAAKVINNS